MISNKQVFYLKKLYLVIDKAGHLIQSPDDHRIALYFLNDDHLDKNKKEHRTEIRSFKGKNLSELLTKANPEFSLSQVSLRILNQKPAGDFL